MNFIEMESSVKLRGGYYTQPEVAAFLARWVLDAHPQRILEPACGDGAFFGALAACGASGVQSVVGCEILEAEAKKSRERARAIKGASVDVFGEDFLSWSLARDSAAPPFDAALGNPPFIRYQYLDEGLQGLAEKIFRRFDLAFTRHTNAWVPFVIASLALLRPGGRLAMVVPSELLHIPHARPLRHFLLEQCSRVLVIDPADIWFGETLQGVVLLMAEKRDRPGERQADVAISPVKDRLALEKPPAQHFREADFFPASVLNGKWMLGLLRPEERELLHRLAGRPEVRPFGEIAGVDVGIVTGANKFFLVPDSVVAAHGLEEWAFPMFGRSEHVRGVVYRKKDHQENRRRGLPANFLWFNERPLLGSLSEAAQGYILTGERQGLHRRYKCRIRTPWYTVPSVHTAPVGMLKRSHHFPRLVLNTAKAFTTDTAYRITPHKVRATDLVFAFVNSLTALSAELEGRHYGGGVLELVPSEIEKVLIPVVRHPLSALRGLDKAVREGTAAESLLARQDALLLRPLGMKQRECETILSAWVRLRDRRQRHPSEEAEEPD